MVFNILVFCSIFTRTLNANPVFGFAAMLVIFPKKLIHSWGTVKFLSWWFLLPSLVIAPFFSWKINYVTLSAFGLHVEFSSGCVEARSIFFNTFRTSTCMCSFILFLIFKHAPFLSTTWDVVIRFIDILFTFLPGFGGSPQNPTEKNTFHWYVIVFVSQSGFIFCQWN